MTTHVDAAAAWIDGAWRRNVRFALDGGRIRGIEDASAGARGVVVPAVHNAHSHAFQFAMRGDSHALIPGHEGDDFWGWRERMYALAGSMSPERVRAVATELYTLMRRSGYASCGEFHYLHHEQPKNPAEPWAMARAHAEAAHAAGIHLTLLPVAYHRGGAGKPAAGAQLRYVFDSAASFIDYVRGMRAALQGPGVTVGIGVHSVRAVPADWLGPIARAAAEDGVPLHIHACEQPRELAECRGEHGVAPIELLEREGFLGPNTVIVHATHLDPGDIERFARSGSVVCACPSTERDLGDGLLVARDLLHAGVGICVGSDSHAVIDAGEELALLEGHERLRLQRRNVLTRPESGLLRPADTLLAAGGRVGAQALGLRSGRLMVGERFDALRWDADPADLDDAARFVDRWLFAIPRRWPDEVFVAGRR